MSTDFEDDAVVAAAIAPADTVDGVQLAPPTVSLLNAALTVNAVNERWVNGLNYIGEGCGTGQIYNLCEEGSTEKNVAGRGVPITGTPFGVVAQNTCSTFGFQTADYRGRAERMLLAVQSYQIARELWSGSSNNPHLANAIDITATGSAAQEVLLLAIGTIEEAFYAQSPGARCMIHMTPGYLEALQTYSGGAALRRGGNAYYTQMDSVVAVDKGYPGTGPAGQAKTFSSEWIYATPIIQIRLGPVLITPDTIGEATLRTTNTVTYFAERAAVYTWDYNCKTIALNVKRTG